MEEQIKALDKSLVIYDRKDSDDEIIVYCKRADDKKYVHQTTIKKVKDIPFNGKKVTIFLTTRRYKNKGSRPGDKKTITEQFDFLCETKRRTKRLDSMLYDLTKKQNFLSSAEYANKYIAKISDDTLINIVLKKTKKQTTKQ